MGAESQLKGMFTVGSGKHLRPYSHLNHRKLCTMPDNEDKKITNDTVKIVSIISGAVLALAFFALLGFLEYLGRTTEHGDVYESPIASLLPLLGPIFLAILTSFVGTGVLFARTQKKLSAIEKQTNGRTHVRDAQIDALVKVLQNSLGDNTPDAIHKALNTAPTSVIPPEADYTDEELRLQKEILRLTEQASKLRNQRN